MRPVAFREWLAEWLRAAAEERVEPIQTQRLRLLAAFLERGALPRDLDARLAAVAPVDVPRAFPGPTARTILGNFATGEIEDPEVALEAFVLAETEATVEAEAPR